MCKRSSVFVLLQAQLRSKASAPPLRARSALWPWSIIPILRTSLSHFLPGLSTTPANRPRKPSTQKRVILTRTSMPLPPLVPPSITMQASSAVSTSQCSRAAVSMIMAGVSRHATRWRCRLPLTPRHRCSQQLPGMKRQTLPSAMLHTARCPSTTGHSTTLEDAFQSVIL